MIEPSSIFNGRRGTVAPVSLTSPGVQHRPLQSTRGEPHIVAVRYKRSTHSAPRQANSLPCPTAANRSSKGQMSSTMPCSIEVSETRSSTILRAATEFSVRWSRDRSVCAVSYPTPFACPDLRTYPRLVAFHMLSPGPDPRRPGRRARPRRCSG